MEFGRGCRTNRKRINVFSFIFGTISLRVGRPPEATSATRSCALRNPAPCRIYTGPPGAFGEHNWSMSGGQL